MPDGFTPPARRPQCPPEPQVTRIGENPHPAISASGSVYARNQWQLIADPKAAVSAAHQLLFALAFFVDLSFADRDPRSPLSLRDLRKLYRIVDMLAAIDVRDVPLPEGPDQSLADYIADAELERLLQ